MPWQDGITGFGEHLYHWIEKRGLTVRGFAERAKTHHSTLSAIRARKIPPPLKNVGKWADILGLEGTSREYFLDLAALECAPPRVLGMFNPAHPAFQAIMMAQDHARLFREIEDLKRRVAEIGAEYEDAPPRNATRGPRK
jgi:transcriptional regulator with XRE-family HTH domain